MTETLSFTYKSIGNFCRLLITILYEKSHTPREIAIFHQRFDKSESDELFESFLADIWPEGTTLGEEELNTLLAYIERFMAKDKETQDLFVKYDKGHYPYYVYFKPDNVIHECKFAQHATRVKEICCDFFKGFSEEEILKVNMKQFIIDNFEISSDNSTIDQIANDCDFITRSIILCDRRKNKTENGG